MKMSVNNGDTLPPNITSVTLAIMLKKVLPSGAQVQIFDGSMLVGVAVLDTTFSDLKHYTCDVPVNVSGDRYTAKIVGSAHANPLSNEFDLKVQHDTEFHIYAPAGSGGSGGITAAWDSPLSGTTVNSTALAQISITNTSTTDQEVIMPQSFTGAVLLNPWFGMSPTAPDTPRPLDNTVLVPAGSTKVVQGEILYTNAGTPNIDLTWLYPNMSLSHPWAGVSQTYSINALGISVELSNDGSSNFNQSFTIPKSLFNGYLIYCWNTCTLCVSDLVNYLFVNVDASLANTWFTIIEDGVRLGSSVEIQFTDGANMAGTGFSVSGSGINLPVSATSSASTLPDTVLTGVYPDVGSFVSKTYAVARLSGPGGSIVDQTDPVTLLIKRAPLEH